MKIAFTICSNNYWAQAKVLFNSLINTNPDYVLIFGLIDKKSKDIDYSINNKNITVVEVADLNIPEEYRIFKKYNIIELSTAVKASYIKWIKKNYPEAEIILYFDPDIKVFSSLNDIETELKHKSVVLTPHVYKPVPIDNKVIPNETLFLTYGIYNLGFIGISFKDREVYDFLDWWEDRLMKVCYLDAGDGIYVDQLPINLAPIFYPKITSVLFHYGMNVAPWNLHERQISLKNNEYYANDDKLVFFHFSYIRFVKGKHPFYNRYDVYPVLEELYETYRADLKESRFLEFKNIPCRYKLKKVYPKSERIIKAITPPVFFRFSNYIKSKIHKS